jgi:hypothetical protein
VKETQTTASYNNIASLGQIMADIESTSRRNVGPSDEEIHNAIHAKQSSPPHLYQPKPSVSPSPALDALSLRSPPSTSTSTHPATSISSPVRLGATTKTARATTKKKHRTSTKATSTGASTMTTVSASSTKDGTTPTQRVSRAKKGKRVHVCDHPGCDKVGFL